ncbi:MAG: response regulator [Anaerolineae bacterium]|nr:response regulator [Anaerolineae bacterium]
MSNTIRLLLIEDDPDVAELLLTYFNMVKFEITHAPDGKEGIALARSQRPSLILLDVMLPDMTGWEIAQKLRSKTLTRYIPIIFLTQRSERSAKIKGLGLGADDYITKPFDVEELRLRVQGTIRRATQERLYEPRTGLPSGSLIEAEWQARASQRGWHRLCVQVSELAAFRDVYGFIAADEALGFAAKAVWEVVQEHGTEDDFIGVDEQDQFVVLTHTHQLKQFQQALGETFATRARALYNFQDAERGYVVLEPGTSQEREAPLMYLHIETVTETPVS